MFINLPFCKRLSASNVSRVGLFGVVRLMSNGWDQMLSVNAGERLAVFLGPIQDDKIPKDAAPGTLMPGTLKLGKLSAQSGGGDIPSPLHFEYW